MSLSPSLIPIRQPFWSLGLLALAASLGQWLLSPLMVQFNLPASHVQPVLFSLAAFSLLSTIKVFSVLYEWSYHPFISFLFFLNSVVSSQERLNSLPLVCGLDAMTGRQE